MGGTRREVDFGFGCEACDGWALNEGYVRVFWVIVVGASGRGCRCGAVGSGVGDVEAFSEAFFGLVGGDAALEPDEEPGVLFDEAAPYAWEVC